MGFKRAAHRATPQLFERYGVDLATVSRRYPRAIRHDVPRSLPNRYQLAPRYFLGAYVVSEIDDITLAGLPPMEPEFCSSGCFFRVFATTKLVCDTFDNFLKVPGNCKG